MHHRPAPGWRLAATVAALALASPLAAQQSPAPATAAPGTTQDTAPTHRSHFGRFGRVFEKAASSVSNVGAKAGISKETAARLAMTAATGGAGAALMQARLQGASSAAALATHRTAKPAAPNAIGPSGSARVSTALTQEAMNAMTDLGRISARAQQHDPAAMRATQALSAAMAKPDGEFVALQQRASAGDPSAAQEMMIREDAIARAALGSEP